MNQNKMTLASLAGRNQSSGYLDGPVDIEGGDDTIIAAKRGEYVIPEEVVRYVGLDKLNKMVEQAKMKMGEQNPQEHMEPKGLPGYATGGPILMGYDPGRTLDVFGNIVSRDPFATPMDNDLAFSPPPEQRGRQRRPSFLGSFATGGYIDDKPKMSLASLADTQQQNANMFKPQQPQMSQGLPGEAIPDEQSIIGTMQGSGGFNAIRAGAQGPYLDKSPLSAAQGGMLNEQWKVNEPGDLSQVEAIRGGLRAQANDPMWQQMEQYKQAPGLINNQTKLDIAESNNQVRKDIADNNNQIRKEISDARIAGTLAGIVARGAGGGRGGGGRAAAGVSRNKPPSGYQWTENGELRAIPGGPADAKNSLALNQKSGMLATIDQAQESLRDLIKHPGREAATGLSSIVNRASIPGSDRSGFLAKLDTFKSQMFIPMVTQMKGLGQLSDAEGKKLTDAVGALDPKMPEKEILQSMNRIMRELEDKRARFTGGQQQPRQAPQASRQPQAGPRTANDYLSKFGGK